jgi:hypothetical protein
MSIRRLGSRLVVPTTFVQYVIRWIGGRISHVNLAVGFARWSSAWLFPRKRSHAKPQSRKNNHAKNSAVGDADAADFAFLEYRDE